jgi:hypothetical protein
MRKVIYRTGGSPISLTPYEVRGQASTNKNGAGGTTPLATTLTEKGASENVHKKKGNSGEKNLEGWGFVYNFAAMGAVPQGFG